MKRSIFLVFILAGACVMAEDANSSSSDDSDEDIGKMIDAIEKDCIKHGNNESFSHLKESVESLKTCFIEFVNFTQLAELKGMAPKVKTVCSLSSQLFGCLKTFAEAAKECMEVEERTNIHDFFNATGGLVDYLCFNDGERVVSFISEEQSTPCVLNKTTELKQCANTTILNDEEEGTEESSKLKFKFEEDECKQFEAFTTCTKEEIKDCSSTSVTFVDDVLSMIKNVTCTAIMKEIIA